MGQPNPRTTLVGATLIDPRFLRLRFCYRSAQLISPNLDSDFTSAELTNHTTKLGRHFLF